MRQKYFLLTAVLILFFGLAGYITSITLKNFNDPIFSCVEGKTTNIIACSFFEKKCNLFNGGIVWMDGHPGPYNFYKCYKKAPDSGKECDSQEDCIHGCDLSVALKLNKCVLISNESLGGVAFKKRYECNSLKPGICNELPQGGRNTGGVSHNRTMEENILMETQTSGSIR